METAAAATPATKKRRTEPHHEGGESEGILCPSPHEPLPPTDAPRSGLPNGPESEGFHGEEPPGAAGGEEEDGVDRISLLPEAILGEIVSLLPTKEAARTRILASRWRGIWLSAPLNLDYSLGGFHGQQEKEEEKVQAAIISRILAAHPGPARRLSVPVLHLLRHPAMVDAWLSSPALNYLQELEFHTSWTACLYFNSGPLPVSALRFSATLRVLAISKCQFPESAVEVLRFPQLRQLELRRVKISDTSLNSIISGSPVLECLLLISNCCSHSIRINSPSLVSIGLDIGSGNLVIEDAPLLERLLQLHDTIATHVLVISAPKLETLGCLYSRDYKTKYTFGTTKLQELKVNSFTTEVRSVKILSVNIYQLSLDTVINLIRFFPCLEKLYIQSYMSRDKNLWRRKHRELVKCLDIRLTTIVLKHYRGIKSQVNFATFFVLNAKRLELMRFEVGDDDDNNHFIAEQHRLLQLEKRASRCAQFYFTSRSCRQYLPHIDHVGDLSKTNPFECGSSCVC